MVFFNGIVCPVDVLGYDLVDVGVVEKCRLDVLMEIREEAGDDPEEIKANLIAQLTAPVRWTQSVRNMIADGAESFTECGPGNVLTGLIRKIK